jgi:hypothetical protein
MARFGQAGEILAGQVLKTGGVGPADLQRDGAGGDEDEGPDRLAVGEMVMAAEIAGIWMMSSPYPQTRVRYRALARVSTTPDSDVNPYRLLNPDRLDRLLLKLT